MAKAKSKPKGKSKPPPKKKEPKIDIPPESTLLDESKRVTVPAETVDLVPPGLKDQEAADRVREKAGKVDKERPAGPPAPAVDVSRYGPIADYFTAFWNRLAQSRAPKWVLTSEERNTLRETGSPLIAKYLPKLDSWGPEMFFAITVIGIGAARMGIEDIKPLLDRLSPGKRSQVDRPGVAGVPRNDSPAGPGSLNLDQLERQAKGGSEKSDTGNPGPEGIR